MGRKIRILLTSFVLLGCAAPTPADAQLRAILDWINSLSGPGLVRVGAGVGLVDVGESSRLTLAPLVSVQVDDRGNADTEAADLSVISVRAALESRLLGRPGSTQLRSSFGAAVHRWSGNFDSYVSPSFPILLVLHVPAQDWAVEVATGFNVFHFPDDAFAPFDTGVATEGFDAGWTVQLSVGYSDLVLFNRR